MSKMTVRGRDLQKGDVLLATNREVVWAGDSARCPAGKITVQVRSLSGRNEGVVREFYWGRGTTFGIRRSA